MSLNTSNDTSIVSGSTLTLISLKVLFPCQSDATQLCMSAYLIIQS